MLTYHIGTKFPLIVKGTNLYINCQHFLLVGETFCSDRQTKKWLPHEAFKLLVVTTYGQVLWCAYHIGMMLTIPYAADDQVLTPGQVKS